MEYNKKGPFIHLFQTPLGYYFYDVNTNQIIKINNDIYIQYCKIILKNVKIMSKF